MNTLFFKTKILLIAIMFAIIGVDLLAQDNKYPDYDEDVFMEWDLEKNLATPVVEKSEKKAVAKYMKGLGESIRKKKFRVELMREGEVVIVSIPTDDLFLPNDTLLTSRGLSILEPLLQYMQDAYMFKVLFTINTDDTGSKKYLEQLSDERNASIYEWFMNQIEAGKMSEDIVLIPYSMASSLPVATNDNREGRARNRRLEIYFVPGPEMIDKAKHKSLK